MGTCDSPTNIITILGFIAGLCLILTGFLAPTECKSSPSRCIEPVYKKKKEEEIAATLLHCKIAGFTLIGFSALLIFLIWQCREKKISNRQSSHGCSYAFKMTILGFIIGLCVISIGFFHPTGDKSIAAILLHCKITGSVLSGFSGFLLPFFLVENCAKKNSAAKEEVPLNQRSLNEELLETVGENLSIVILR